MTPEERYRSDPLFHRLVEVLLAQLRECQMTATEIREAAMLAAQIHEMTSMRSFIIPNNAPPLSPGIGSMRCRGCVDPNYTHASDCPEFATPPGWGRAPDRASATKPAPIYGEGEV